MKRFCYRILKDPVEVEKALIRIEERTRSSYLRKTSANEKIENFKAWVYTIARNEVKRGLDLLDRHRLESLLPEHEPGLQVALPEESAASPMEGPLLLREAFRKKVISDREYDVIRYDLSGFFKDRQEIADQLGITRTNCDVLYLRGIRKIILAFFTRFAKYLGGPAHIEAIFQHVLKNPPPEFTGSEKEAFTQLAVMRNRKYRPTGNAFEAACQKMIQVPAIRDSFLF
ncbi:RNA polymerase sigma factor [Larkinella harenae]